MARVISQPEQLYQPGTYGPYPVDQLSNANTEALEFTMTVGADWPADRTVSVVRVTVAWDSGGGASWLYNGGLRAQDGTPLTLIRERAYISTEGETRAKRAVGGGTITFQAFVPITTAVTLAGV